jgi:hypothetical protein
VRLDVETDATGIYTVKHAPDGLIKRVEARQQRTSATRDQAQLEGDIVPLVKLGGTTQSATVTVPLTTASQLTDKYEPDGAIADVSARAPATTVEKHVLVSKRDVDFIPVRLRARPQIIESTFDRVIYWVYNHV